MEFTFDPNARLDQFKQKISYDEAIRGEDRDGLVEIDFRKLETPEFIKEWPDSNDWSFSRDDYLGEHYYYRWGIKGTGSSAVITAKVCDDYECAQRWFFAKAKSSSMWELPWVACSNKVGTACAETQNKELRFFVYKNIAIDIETRHNDAFSDQDDFGEKVAEWLFAALKAAPLKPFPAADSSRKP
ncbi:MAG: hypothetical protein LBF16_07490 [Pseudomonadales bacterium]|nr:hypothetical protein [Pseudomonadales bacterium]